jgi:P-type Cu2+ transporter
MATCEHCGTAFSANEPGEKYCCRGCDYVATLIREGGLGRFYDLKDGMVVAPVRSRPFEDHDFSWLAPAMEQAEREARRGIAELDCAIEGISCVGCVWLISKLFEQKAGAVRAAAQPATGRLHLSWQAGECEVREFLGELSSFGYVAAPTSARSENPERGKLAARMGLCGAFALNAMAFSLPTYLGMPMGFEFAGLFRLIAFISATLAMLVGSGYFISRAWRGLKIGVLHIDLPISLGLIAAYMGSIIGWVQGNEHMLYFDFVATFVFLMLTGRYIQTAAVERNRQRLVRRSPLPPELDTGEGKVALGDLKPGQRFQISAGQALPVASCLVEGEAEISLEWINGEAEPVSVHAGARLPAGAILLSRRTIVLTADELWQDSILSRLMHGPTTEHGSPLLEKLLRVYLLVVLVIGAATLMVWGLRGHWTEGLQAMISVFVVSCPCALGVAIPMADEMAAARLARAGAFVRNATLWSRLRRVKKVIFDKTGTLTLERPELVNPSAVDSLEDEAALALVRLTRGSLHPVSRSLLERLGAHGQRLLDAHGGVEILEEPGFGVSYSQDGCCWRLARGAEAGTTVLSRNDESIAVFTFSDTIRPGAMSAIQQLRQRHLSMHILSGDAPAKVGKVAAILGLDPSQSHGGLSPEEKSAHVSALDQKDTLYLGDGANDSLAFDHAYVTATPVVDRSLLEGKADFYTLGSGLAFLPEAFRTADARARGVRWAFIFALSYNLCVVYAAAMGHMSPYLAAILMPLSSVVSILLVTAGLRTVSIEILPDTSYGGGNTTQEISQENEPSGQRVRIHPA